MSKSLLAELTRKTALFCLMLCFVACQKNVPDKLQLAVSANMQYAMTEIGKEFSRDSGIPCEIIVGSSGKLTAQILEGAPFDVFLSADLKYPELLYETGLADGPPTIYAHGTLVLWSTKDGVDPSLEALRSGQLRHLAIASPDLAPYGEAALTVLERLGWKEQLRGKMVFGESISQTSQFIVTGAADMGFTAKSVVMSPRVKGVGQWIEVADHLYEPIAQGMIILKGPADKIQNAKSFQNFLLSDKGKEILALYGYQTAMENE